MPRSRLNGRTVAMLLFLLTFFVAASAQNSHGGPSPSTVNVRATPSMENPIAILHGLIQAARLDDLRWPVFSDYRADVAEFYERTHYGPAWLREGHPTPQALQMIDILQHADREGLHAEDYDAPRWTERLTRLARPHPVADEVRFDTALTVSAMRYASDLRDGKLNPQYFQFALNSGPKRLDLAGFVLQRLAQGSNLQSELAAIEPPFVEYRELRGALIKYLQLAQEDDGEKLPMPQGSGYPGPPYPGFIRLARLLRLLGDLPADYSIAAASARAYDPALLDAVRHFQERHGLPQTGYLDTNTIQQLNVPLAYRVEQIRLALERYRWLHYDFPQSPIVVNIPGFHLYAFAKSGKPALTMRVDVGDDFATTRTPVMQDNLEYLVFRPYWDVPIDIQKDEIVPALLEDPNYLAKYHFEVITPAGQVVTGGGIAPKILSELRTGKLRVRQRPGPENALGLVKFIFPNRFNVYLHDIPSRDFYFGMAQRVVSHGCVHVEHPADLAAWVLRDQPQWTLARIRQAMQNGRDNFRVNLSKPLPVLFIYTTAMAHANGEVDFYRDIYGYDSDLLQALAKGYPYPKPDQITRSRHHSTTRSLDKGQ